MTKSRQQYYWIPFKAEDKDDNFITFTKSLGNDLLNHAYLFTSMLCCLSCMPCCDDYYYKSREKQYKNYQKEIKKIEGSNEVGKSPSFDDTTATFKKLIGFDQSITKC